MENCAGNGTPSYLDFSNSDLWGDKDPTIIFQPHCRCAVPPLLFSSSLLVQKGKRRICQARFTAKQIKIHKAMCHSPSTRLFFNHGFSVIFKLKVIRSYKTIGIFGNGVLEPFYDWNKKVLRQGKIEHRDYSRKKIQKQANAVCIFS